MEQKQFMSLMVQLLNGHSTDESRAADHHDSHTKNKINSSVTRKDDET